MLSLLLTIAFQIFPIMMSGKVSCRKHSFLSHIIGKIFHQIARTESMEHVVRRYPSRIPDTLSLR